MSDEAGPLGDKSGDDLDKLVAACSRLLPPPEQWTGVAGYPEGIALAVIDAIWSLSTRYPITCGVIRRYRGFRRLEQADASNDSLSDLLDLYDRLGGVDAFIDTIGTRNRVSTQPGAARKAEAVHTAASLLKDLGIDTAEQFQAAEGTGLGQSAQDAWRTVPGQGSGDLLAVSTHAPRPTRRQARSDDQKVHRRGPRSRAGHARAGRRRRPRPCRRHPHERRPRTLDHEIWEYQSGRRGTHDPQSTHEHIKAAARAQQRADRHAAENAHSNQQHRRADRPRRMRIARTRTVDQDVPDAEATGGDDEP